MAGEMKTRAETEARNKAANAAESKVENQAESAVTQAPETAAENQAETEAAKTTAEQTANRPASAEPKQLSFSEEQVMAALWQLPAPVQRIDLQKALAQKFGWADSTILNFLYRLQEKGFVTMQKQGNRNCYTPAVRRQDYAAQKAAALLTDFCGGSLVVLLEDLSAAGSLRLHALEELRGHMDSLIAQSPEYSEYYDPWEG